MFSDIFPICTHLLFTVCLPCRTLHMQETCRYMYADWVIVGKECYMDVTNVKTDQTQNTVISYVVDGCSRLFPVTIYGLGTSIVSADENSIACNLSAYAI